VKTDTGKKNLLSLSKNLYIYFYFISVLQNSENKPFLSEDQPTTLNSLCDKTKKEREKCSKGKL